MHPKHPMPTPLRTLIFSLLAPGTVGGLLPYLLGTRGSEWFGVDWELPLGIARHAGWLLVAAGTAGYALSSLRFTYQGEGTPSPFDPPRRFVVSGLYRNVRNPMYVSVAAIVAGQALLLEATIVLLYLLLVFAMFQIFVVWYEEPSLRRRFGASYEEYLRRVPRWIPRRAPACNRLVSRRGDSPAASVETSRDGTPDVPGARPTNAPRGRARFELDPAAMSSHPRRLQGAPALTSPSRIPSCRRRRGGRSTSTLSTR